MFKARRLRSADLLYQNTIWAHLESVRLVCDQSFLEVNLVETTEVYIHLRIPKNTILFERKQFLIAKSYESIVSVVPQRFAFLETFFL